MFKKKWRLVSIFLKFYTGLISTLILIFSIIYLSIQEINDYRYSNHVAKWIVGPASLVAEKWMHQPENRSQWLQTINKSSSTQWHVVDSIPLGTRPHIDHQRLFIKADWKTQSAQIWWLLDSNLGLYLTAEFDDIYESLTMVLSTAILHNLNQLPHNKHQAEYEQLKERLNFPITVLPWQQSKLDFTTAEILHSGTPVTARKHGLNTSYYTLYIPTLNPNLLLKIGPMPTFHWITTAIVIPSIIAVLSLIALAVLVLTNPLRQRLIRITNAIGRIEDNPESINVPTDGNDCLSAIAYRISNVAHRLVRSLEKNRELNQAVSHELKTPLARMRFRIELLGNNNVNQQRLAAHLGRDLNQLEGLVNELLFFHKIDNQSNENYVEFELSPIINDIIEETTELDNQVSLHSEVTLGAKVRGRLPEIRRLIKNLVENSCRYGAGIVHISTDIQYDKLTLIVEDNGGGIPAPERERMLQPFTRLEASRNKNTGGTGLGLAICQRIVQSHNGTLFIEQSWLGGCKFRVSLPG